MEYIYMDNYKGFSDTLCPLEGMNFLVGENSTGKTSLLSLLSLFCSLGKTPMFGTDITSVIGAFDECVSSASEKKSSFKVGNARIVKENSKYRVESYCYAIENKGGSSVIKLYAQTCPESGELFIRFDSAAKYRSAPCAEFNTEEEARDYLVAFYHRVDPSVRKGFKRYEEDLIDDSLEKYPLFFLVYSALATMRTVEEDGKQGLPPIFPGLSYRYAIAMDPVRSAPRKYYDASYKKDGDDDLSAYIELNRLSKSTKEEDRERMERLREFGKKSGLFDALETKSLGGKSKVAPFEVVVDYGNARASIKGVGYGVSQALPLVMECLRPVSDAVYTIQQPEVHLHPRAQAAFGTFLYETMGASKNMCVVETHSDYLIDRYRLSYKRAMVESDIEKKCQVLFFERKGGVNTVTPIAIGKDGRYSENQPEGFRRFFLDEAFDMLEV